MPETKIKPRRPAGATIPYVHRIKGKKAGTYQRDEIGKLFDAKGRLTSAREILAKGGELIRDDDDGRKLQAIKKKIAARAKKGKPAIISDTEAKILNTPPPSSKSAKKEG